MAAAITRLTAAGAPAGATARPPTRRALGAVRVYQPEGRDRLSDWGRQPEIFRYVETADTTLIINMAHVVEVSEVIER